MTKVYYKATRLDGTDFRTGTVLYQVGERTTHPTSTRRTKDDPSTYLSVSTVPTDCTGMKWPCRLFAVHGVGRAMTAKKLPNKRAFLAVDVVEELPAHQAFGPQGEHVAALIERAGRLTGDEMEQLAAAWDAAWDAAKDAARDAAGDAARYAAWAAAWAAAGDAARALVVDAAGDAAGALVVYDLIGRHGFTQKHYDLLVGPWESVIGPVMPNDGSAP